MEGEFIEETAVGQDENGSGLRVSRARSITASVLVVVTSLAVIAASVGSWVHYVALDTDAWMEIVEPSVTSDEFKTALSDKLATSTIEALDAEGRLENRFSALDTYLGSQLVEALDLGPAAITFLQGLDIPSFADLAAPIAESVNAQITESIDNAVRSDAFEVTILSLVRASHEASVVALTGGVEDLEHVYVEDGLVKWNALPLVLASIEWVIEEGILGGEEIELPDLSDNPVLSETVSRMKAALGSTFPDDLGQITVMTEDQLASIEATGQMFDRLVWLLVVGALVLLAITLVVSPRRRRTLTQVAIAVLIALFLSYVAVQTIVASIQESFIEPEGGEAFLKVATEVINSLRDVWIGIGVATLLVLIVGYLAGKPPWISDLGARPKSEAGGDPTDFELFIARHFDLLSMIVIAASLAAIALIGLSWLWTPLVLVILGGLLWYGSTVRDRQVAVGVDQPESESAGAE